MAVQVVRPKEWKEADLVEVESDANDNYFAIKEIESWSSQHGLIRTTEQWLRAAIKSDGGKVYRALCYRQSPEEREAVRQSIAAREAIAFAGHDR